MKRLAMALLLLGTTIAGVLPAARAYGSLPEAVGSHDAPKVVGPSGGVRIGDFGLDVAWSYEGRAMTQFHVQVVPANSDGPGVDLVRKATCCFADGFTVPAPPAWYGLLPDITYSWRVRATAATQSVPLTDDSWTAWSDWQTFKTPLATSDTISAMLPVSGDILSVAPPVVICRDDRAGIFYYEVQMSADGGFDTNPATAKAAVYWNLVHGGVTVPPDSWAPPQDLLRGRDYYWRVRPRIQGDGKPVDWTPAFRFTLRP